MPTSLDYDDAYNRATWIGKGRGSRAHHGFIWDIVISNDAGGPKEYVFEVDQQRLMYFQLSRENYRLFDKPCPVVYEQDEDGNCTYSLVTPEEAADWRKIHAKRDEAGYLRSTGLPAKRKAEEVAAPARSQTRAASQKGVSRRPSTRPRLEGRRSTAAVGGGRATPAAASSSTTRRSNAALSGAAVDPLFDDVDGDLTLVSNDGAEARVRSVKLVGTSEVFERMLDEAEDRTRLAVHESASDLGIFLRYSLDPEYVASRDVDFDTSLKLFGLMQRYGDKKGLALRVAYLADHLDQEAPDVFAVAALVGDTSLARRALARIGQAVQAQGDNVTSARFCADILQALLGQISSGLLSKLPTGAMRNVYDLLEKTRLPSATLARLDYPARWAKLVEGYKVR